MKKIYMTPAEFAEAQVKLDLDDGALAAVLRLNSGRAIRAYKTGERTIPGPVSVCIDAIMHLGIDSVRKAIGKGSSKRQRVKLAQAVQSKAKKGTRK